MTVFGFPKVKWLQYTGKVGKCTSYRAAGRMLWWVKLAWQHNVSIVSNAHLRDNCELTSSTRT